MLKLIDQERDAATAGSALSLKRIDRRLRSVAKMFKPATAIRGSSNLPRDRGVDGIQPLLELEAENAELRNTAIELALQIQDLRERVRLAPCAGNGFAGVIHQLQTSRGRRVPKAPVNVAT